MNWNTEIKKKKWIIAFDFKERYEKEDIGKKIQVKENTGKKIYTGVGRYRWVWCN